MSIATEWKEVPEFFEPKPIPSNFEKFDLDELMRFDPASDPNNLIGNRWLCRGMAAMIFSAAGKGKSSLRGDMSAAWALGQSWNGLKPVRPLRIVILQGENDLGDEGEILQGVMHSRRGSDADLQTLRQNLQIFRLPCITGARFCAQLSEFISANPCDLVWLDPLFHVAGQELGTGGNISGFLREELEPIMRKTGVAVIWNHHSTKPPRERSAKADLDWSHAFHGSVEILNFVRAAAVLIPSDTEPGVSEFRCIKRERRTGLTDEEGNWSQSIWLQQAEGFIGWNRIPAPDGTGQTPAATADKLQAYAAARRKACTSPNELPSQCADQLAGKFSVTPRTIYAWEKVYRAICLEHSKYEKSR